MALIALAGFTFQGRLIVRTVSVPDNMNGFILSIDTVTHTSRDVRITIGCEMSIDGGPFRLLTSSTREGGSFLNDEGLPVTSIGFEAKFFPGINRQVRFFSEATGGSFTTTGGTLVTT